MEIAANHYPQRDPARPIMHESILALRMRSIPNHIPRPTQYGLLLPPSTTTPCPGHARAPPCTHS
eukprot:5274685-Prorocentrum_lima.AAC.1